MGKAHGKHSTRGSRRRKAGLVAAAGSLLVVPAITAGDTLAWAAVHQGPRTEAPPPAPTDPTSVGADGSLPASSAVGQQVLNHAGNPGLLAGAGPQVTVPSGSVGIPGTALQAYMRTADLMKTVAPDCHISWPLLAGIGRIESGHASGGRVDANGNTLSPILGPVLNGGGFAAIADTDGGRYDGDSRWDRAVGPMQFIPSTWAGYASDGNGDGVTSPSNIYDATLGAAKYLCSGGLDLSDPQQQATAVFRYNHSDSYVRTVLLWASAYAQGVTPLPMTPVPPEIVQRALAPVAPGSSGGHSRNDSTPPHSSSTSHPATPTTISGPSSTTTTPPSSTTTTTTPPPTSCTTTTTPTTTTTTGGESPSSASQSAASESSASSSSSSSAAADTTTTTTTTTTTSTPPPSC